MSSEVTVPYWMYVMVIFMMLGLYEYAVVGHRQSSTTETAEEKQSIAQLDASTRNMYGAFYDSDVSFCNTVRKYMGWREAEKTATCWGPRLSREDWTTRKMNKR